MPDLAQKKLVERFIDWSLIEARLARYESIGKAFPMALLLSRRHSPPYFCHYMAWRLGTWRNERLFERLEELLHLAEDLPNWTSERSLLESAEFADYWALMWQLQVAEYLTTVGTEVQWSRGGGPDLSVRLGDTTLYVECFVFRKSFGIAIFLEEVLSNLGPDIKCDHDYCLPFSLPKNNATAGFLDETLRPFLDENNLVRWRSAARERWPVKIAEPASTLVIYLEGDDMEVHDPRAIASRTGEPAFHIPVVLREAVTQKTGKNRLSERHPNLVAVNFLLSADAQLALHLREITQTLDLGPDIDALAIAFVGIQETLTRQRLLLVRAKDPRTQALALITQELS